MTLNRKPIIKITMGDAVGTGPEIIVKALSCALGGSNANPVCGVTPMSEPVIRAVEQRDLPAIYKIERETFKDAFPPFFIDFLVEENPETFLVAEETGEVVGYVVASVEKKVGHLVSLAVRRDRLRKAVGSSLVLKILEILKRSGVSSVRLEVRKSNVAAQNFYNKLGFSFVRVYRGYYGDEDAYVLEKKL